MLPLQEEHVKKWRERAEERSWWGTNDEPGDLSLSWHPHHSLLALSSAPQKLTAPWPAHGHGRSMPQMCGWGEVSQVSARTQGTTAPGAPGHPALALGDPAPPPAPVAHDHCEQHCVFPSSCLRSPDYSCSQWGHPTWHMFFLCLQHLVCTTAAHLHCCPLLRPPLPLRHTSMKCHYTKLKFFCSLLKPDSLCFHRCNTQFNPQEMQSYVTKMLFTQADWSFNSFQFQWICYNSLQLNWKMYFFEKSIDKWQLGYINSIFRWREGFKPVMPWFVIIAAVITCSFSSPYRCAVCLFPSFALP